MAELLTEQSEAVVLAVGAADICLLFVGWLGVAGQSCSSKMLGISDG